MGEIKSLETSEIKRPSEDNYREIKPQGDITKQESKEFWNNKFSQNDTEQPRVYLDDNGKEYRTEDSLEPNTTYIKDGYEYKTDDHGRIISAEGELQVKDHSGRKEMPDNMETIAKGAQKETDDRGHLIADRFNGSGEMANLVPMDKELNRGDYAKLEDTLADAQKDGAKVQLKVEPVYTDDTNRPSEFRVTYTIDGEKDVVVFKNGGSD